MRFDPVTQLLVTSSFMQKYEYVSATAASPDGDILTALRERRRCSSQLQLRIDDDDLVIVGEKLTVQQVFAVRVLTSSSSGLRCSL